MAQQEENAMPLEQLANIAEVFGLLVVAITLIFLTIQMRQNTKMLRSTATHGAHDQITSFYHPLISDPSLTDLWLRGLREPSKLSAVETGRFFAWWLNTFFILQNWYFQTREGLIDKELLNSFSKLMTDMQQTPGVRNVWEQRKYMYAADFVSYMDDEVFGRSPTHEYRPLGVAEEQH
jgi:hypothetical protein